MVGLNPNLTKFFDDLASKFIQYYEISFFSSWILKRISNVFDNA